MKIIHEITLDLAQRGVQASIPLTQSDAGIHSLIIRLRNGSREVKINGTLTATLWVSNDTFEPVKIYMDNGAFPNSFEYDVSAYVTKDAGEFTAQLQVFELGVGMFSAPEFILLVRKDVTANSNVLTESPFQAVAEAKMRAEAAAKEANDAKDDILDTAGDLNTGLEAILQLQQEILKPGGIVPNGLSAYQLAVENGFVGTEQEWLESLKGDSGKDGADGKNGNDGYTPVRGTDYWTPTDKAEMISEVISALPVYDGEVVSV